MRDGLGHDRGEPSCRHWQAAARCSESCGCGHGCADHHDAGWCSRCTCLVWQDAPEQFDAPLMPSRDDWRLEEIFDEQERRAYDEAAGF
jgi:hypothetical protein